LLSIHNPNRKNFEVGIQPFAVARPVSVLRVLAGQPARASAPISSRSRALAHPRFRSMITPCIYLHLGQW